MQDFDLHVHSVFSDGKDEPRDIVLSAIDAGIKTLGFSDHSYTEFDERYCIQKNSRENYINAVNALKSEFSGKIRILCGTEQDFYSTSPTDGYDYVIGSVHYILVNGEYIPVDETAEILKKAAQEHFSGDMMSLCEAYFEEVGAVYERTKCDIVGHFDLITKFNEQERLFDESDPRYTNAYQKAVDRIIKNCKVFEINTGAISRGYRTSPYPSDGIRAYIRQKGGKFILSSDSHQKETLRFEFEKFSDLV